MCGIVGYVGGKEASPLLRDGLKFLEYRGYDSAGLAIHSGGNIGILRSLGKLKNLDALALERPLAGSVGLGHTRWATHGSPSVDNAHPHADCTGRVAVVHNGIIENYSLLKSMLEDKGHVFRSQTDTEVVAHLVEEMLKSFPVGRLPQDKTTWLLEAVRRALLQMRGAYALGILWSELPDRIVAAKNSSPLVVGLGAGETFVASDVPAFLKHTRDVHFLEDGEFAVLGATERIFFNSDGRRVEKVPVVIPWDHTAAQKGGFKHFMLKEIHEQPAAVASTLRGRVVPVGEATLSKETGIPSDYLRSVKQVQIIACGTSYHAGMVGRYLLEKYARIPTQVEIASEFRYREPVLGPGTLVIAVSQSGETADTLAAVKQAKEAGCKVLAISNTVGSAIARSADFNLYTRCGPECGVASTKAYVGQVAGFLLFSLHSAVMLGKLSDKDAKEWVKGLERLPETLKEVLDLEPRIKEIAARLLTTRSCLFLGRGLDYPTSLEGALKLKEISYIHAEGYAAGEMKHGPIALIEPGLPVIAVATDSAIFEKVASNLEEARARGASIIALVSRGETRLNGKADDILELPIVPEVLAPIVNILPLQLLAYHVSDLRGCDVDQPRNLAKSVTVE